MNIDKAKDYEQIVANYYGRKSMADGILDLAHKNAKNPENLLFEDLKKYDQMHIGGYESAEAFFAHMGLTANMDVLDIGSGLGGPARIAAAEFGVKAYGIDITPEYEKAAKTLSRAVGLHKKTDFMCASALDMPFEDKVFDAVYMIHAGMNIDDKKTLISEVARVLKRGGVFGIYDVFANSDDVEIKYPMPWAQDEKTSFLVTKEGMVKLLESKGFEILKIVDHYENALSSMEKVINKGDQPEMFVNLHTAIKKFRLSPQAIYARR